VIGSATLLFGIIALWVLIKVRDLLTCAWAVVLAYLLIGCHWFQPWYATWLIALTAITVNRRLVTYAAIFTWFMLLHPIMAQFLVAPLKLPSWDYSLVMATATLLVPQFLALRLIAPSKTSATS
jgi:hypothetical protein